MTVEQLAYPGRLTADEEGDGRLRNWAGNATLGEWNSVTTPADADELQSFLAGTTGPVRILGSRMSPGRLLESVGEHSVLVDPRHLSGLRSLSGNSFTFGGATPLQEVYDLLFAHGRMLPSSPGVIASQTLAGAISTGTHGQGLQQSSIVDSATAIKMVLADGSAHHFTADHPWFAAVQLGLGSLGVITEVTLRTVPTKIYSCRKYAVDAAGLAEELQRRNRDNLLVKAWWFPQHGQVHVWAAGEASGGELDRYYAGGAQLLKGAASSDALNRTIDHTLSRMHDDTKLEDHAGKPFQTVTRFKDFADVTGDIYQVFCQGIPTPQINVEIAVPMSRATEAIKKIKAWYARTGPQMHYPVIIRCTGPSNAWLSPSSGQNTCYFGFVVYYAQDGSVPPEGESFLRAVEKVLAAEGGRPHWGKYFDESLYDWPELYPRWDDFRRVREILDPGRRFANAFTTALFD